MKKGVKVEQNGNLITIKSDGKYTFSFEVNGNEIKLRCAGESSLDNFIIRPLYSNAISIISTPYSKIKGVYDET